MKWALYRQAEIEPLYLSANGYKYTIANAEDVEVLEG